MVFRVIVCWPVTVIPVKSSKLPLDNKILLPMGISVKYGVQLYAYKFAELLLVPDKECVVLQVIDLFNL